MGGQTCSKVRKARRNVACPFDGGDVFMYRDSSVASPIHPVTQDDFQSEVGGGIGEFRGVVEGLHCKVSESPTPLGQRLLCVLPVVDRIGASARKMHLDWFRSWVPDSV